MKFTVKKLKTYRGHEGEPLAQGDLYIDGKKAGFLSQGDWGGPAILRIDDPSLSKKVDEYIANHAPVENEYGGDPFAYSEDFFVEDILCDALDRRDCSRKTIFKIKNANGKTATMEMREKFSPGVKDFIVRKYGDSLVEIVNERLAP